MNIHVSSNGSTWKFGTGDKITILQLYDLALLVRVEQKKMSKTRRHFQYIGDILQSINASVPNLLTFNDPLCDISGPCRNCPIRWKEIIPNDNCDTVLCRHVEEYLCNPDVSEEQSDETIDKIINEIIRARNSVIGEYV